MLQEPELTKRLTKLHSLYIHDTKDPNFKHWRQFVLDHKDDIINDPRTERIDLSKEEMYHTRYKLKNYLNRQGKNQNLLWIILMINDMNNEIDFINMSFIIIPSESKIAELKRSYQSYIQYYTKP